MISNFGEFLSVVWKLNIAFPLCPVNRIAMANIWINVLNLARPVTGIEILDFAKNSLNPEINISLIRIIIAAMTS